MNNLPALIDSATRHLAEAKTSAELLQARDVAKAALHYAKITKATNATQADCLRIIIAAQTRMADEIDKGRDGGKIRTQADNQLVQNPDKHSYEDLGVTRQRVSEYRKTMPSRLRWIVMRHQQWAASHHRLDWRQSVVKRRNSQGGQSGTRHRSILRRLGVLWAVLT